MQEPENFDDLNSKSRRKKDMLALQKIGEALVELPAPQLAKVPLESPLKEAIDQARRITDHEGKRRQLQYVGKLMRHVDIEPIQDALDKIQRKDQYSKAQFHQVERWRDRFIAEGDAILQEFLQKYSNVDMQHLRQLLRNAQKDVKTGKNTGADTALFRYLRDVIES